MKRHFNAKFSLEIENEICELYKTSIRNSCKALGRKYGCSWGTINNILRKHKVPIRSNSVSQTGLRTGSQISNYKGGCLSSGYRRISVLRDGKRQVVLEHRHLVEEAIGRRLSNDEVVHHVNHNKLDNKLENLEIMTRAEHLIHHKINDCWITA